MYINSIVIIKGGTNYGKRRNSSKKRNLQNVPVWTFVSVLLVKPFLQEKSI